MNWADIVLIVVLAGSMYFGWKKGFIVAAVELIKWVATIAIARVFHVPFTRFFTEHFYDPSERVSKHVRAYLFDFFKYDPLTEQSMSMDQVSEALGKLTLPDFFEEMVHEKVGGTIVRHTIDFVDAVSVQMTEMIVNGIGFLVLVILLLIGFSFIQFFGIILSKLPLLKELNQGGGVIVGAVIGVVAVYFIMAILSFFPTFGWSISATEAIEESSWAIYFYKYNILKYAFRTILIQGHLKLGG